MPIYANVCTVPILKKKSFFLKAKTIYLIKLVLEINYPDIVINLNTNAWIMVLNCFWME